VVSSEVHSAIQHACMHVALTGFNHEVLVY
jgi:hypothetical protein